MLLYLQEIIEQSEFSHYVEQEVCQILCCCETKVLARYSQKSLSIEDSYGMKALYVWCSKFWFAVIKHSFKKQQKVSCLDHCFIDTKNHHKKEARWRIFSDTEPHRREKKKCLFGQRALEVWLEHEDALLIFLKVAVNLIGKRGFLSQPHWVRGFLRTSRRIHTNEIYTWCIQYRGICIWKRSKHTKCLQRSANDKSSTFQIFIKLITSPMCPAGRCWNCTKSDLLELTNVESPHGLWCWTTSSEHPWKQLHVVGVMHCPDIKPENSGEDQFKGKSWVPLGEYPRYKATKKTPINMGLYHACIGYTVPSDTQNVPLINRLLSFLMSICDWEGRSPT